MAYNGQPPQTSDGLRFAGLIVGIVLLVAGILGLLFILVAVGAMSSMMGGMMGGSGMMGSGMMTAGAAPWLVLFGVIAVAGLVLTIATARR